MTMNWDGKYTAAAAAVPVYWAGVMLPRVAKALWAKCTSAKDGTAAKTGLESFTRRCDAAHKNGWEGLSVFTSGIVVSAVAGTDPSLVNACAVFGAASRVLYGPAYFAVESGPLSLVRVALFWAGVAATGALWGAAFLRTTTWEESYVGAVAAVPAYYLFLMLPAMFKGHYAGRNTRNIIKFAAEPRQAVADLIRSGHARAGQVRRALAAHENGWENFTILLSGVAVATAAKCDPGYINTLAVVAAAARFFYSPAYIFVEGGALTFLRSALYMVDFGSSFAMWVAALKAAGPTPLTAAFPALWVLNTVPHVAKYLVLRRRTPLSTAALNADPRAHAQAFVASEDPEAAFVGRALRTHTNGWEALGVYSSAVAALLLTGTGGSSPVDACVVGFLAARVAYVAAFLLSDSCRTRGLAWLAGQNAVAGLWVASILNSL